LSVHPKEKLIATKRCTEEPESILKMEEHANPLYEADDGEQAPPLSPNASKSCPPASPFYKHSTEGVTQTMCIVCSSEAIAFANYPCQCCRYCKKCAMKLATGGKCRMCNEIFTSMTGIHRK
jgi:hypothetical protein